MKVNTSIFLVLLSIILLHNTVFSSVFRPPKVHKVYNKVEASTKKNDDIVKPAEKRDLQNASNSYEQIAINHLIKEIGITAEELLLKDILVDATMVNVHFSQVIKGKEIYNSAANVNIHKKTGKVLSFGSNLIPLAKASSAAENTSNNELENQNKVKFIYNNGAKTELSEIEAVLLLSERLGYVLEKNNLTIETNAVEPDSVIVRGVSYTINNYIEVSKKVVILGINLYDEVYEMSVELEDHWFMVELSTTTGELREMYDLTKNATYTAVPWYYSDVGNGGRQVLKNPEIKEASPKGWNRDNKFLYYRTKGNNVKAVLNWNNDTDYSNNENTVGVSTKKELIFNYAYSNTAQKARDNFKAATVNAFYITNILHDFFYKYGFTEQYGNFQTTNWGKGGKENDQLVVLVQHGEGYNNAYMSTGVDGKSPRMKLLIYNRVKGPERDTALSNQIIAHEYTHGVSSRLVGGPSKSSCLNDSEADGISEGLSDFFSIILNIRKNDKRTKEIVWNQWLSGGTSRRYKYSTNVRVNTLFYSSLTYTISNGLESHFSGTVWCTLLYEVMWNVLDEYNISNNVLLDPNGSEDANIVLSINSTSIPGNIRIVKIIVDSMKLMPCNPTFIEARDSIILAQKQFSNYKRMRCALWKGFAKRGLGVNAKDGQTDSTGKKIIYTNNFDIPNDC